MACWGYSRFGGSPIPVTITLPDSEDGSSNDTAIIVGVVVGVGVGVAAVIGGLWYVVQKKRKRHRPVVVPAISTVDSHTKGNNTSFLFSSHNCIYTAMVLYL